MVIVPVGIINEFHEPPTFYSVDRPYLERNIIPTTWRENGVGVYGDVGPVSYSSARVRPSRSSVRTVQKRLSTR